MDSSNASDELQPQPAEPEQAIPTSPQLRIPKAVRIAYSLFVLVGFLIILPALIPNVTSRSKIAIPTLIVISLIPGSAYLAARAWSQPVIFLAFGMVTATFCLDPGTWFEGRRRLPSVMGGIVEVLFLVSIAVGSGLLCRYIAMVTSTGSYQPSPPEDC